MRFYLNFKSDNYGKKEIQEPFGTSDINFSLKQKDNGMGRDISFSGDDIQFEFTHMRNHELKQLLYYHRKFGFEAIVELTIEVDELNKYVCDLDFATAETDDLEYFKCKGIEDSKLQIIKARKSVKVDLLSDVDVDGNYIGGLVPDNILLLAKPVVQNSEWSQPNDFYKKIFAPSSSAVFTQNINPCLNLEKYGIEDSYTFFVDSEGEFSNLPNSSFKVLKAKNNLTNIQVIVNLNLFLNVINSGGSGEYVDVSVKVRYGNVFETATENVLLYQRKTDGETFSFDGILSNQILSLERDSCVWVYVNIKNRIADYEISISNMSMKITAESTAYNSISKSIRLVDAMNQVIKSISGLQINAPRFQSLGQFYDNRLINGNFLRGVIDKPFYFSLEDIENSITEMKGDYEIGSDGKIFFGIESDFYQPIESGFFDNTQFSEMSKTFNPKYMINEFGFKYKNFQSLKENEEANSADTIHGESKLVFFNKNVENKKEVSVEWTRDAFLIEATRRKALEITESTASQDDDTVFCIDSIDTTFDYEFTEVTQLEHTFSSDSGRLILRNDGTINFISLGIIVGSLFVIQPIDLNAGSYTVFSVTSNSLELTKISGTVTSLGNGNRLTKYAYTLDQNSIPFTNYTSQGFTETTGLGAPNSYSNRRYSIMRNIYNYYNSYLATANIYWKSNPLKNTWYKNNGDYTAKYNGVKLTEKSDFIPSNPILSPILYNEIILANIEFTDFITLQSNIRSQRGFIRSIDNNSQVIKVYPTEIEYSLLEKELRIKGEEKHEPTSMTISTANEFILINNETRVLTLSYEIKNEKVYIFDENRYRLYNGVYWNEVKINNAFANSKIQLENWLSLL